jgi:2-C-methyl-D-erythritol 4-phosphate cytidylyltransferase
LPPRVGVVVPAGGSASRLGRRGVEALVQLGGRPLLAHALTAIQANRSVAAVVVVADPDALDDVAKLLADEGFAKLATVVGGPATRQASVAAGLAALPAGPAYVAVHDAARPLVAPGEVDRLLGLLEAAAGRPGGIVPGVPVTDTIRRVGPGGRSLGGVDRDELRAIQAPQLFVRVVLEEAHRRALRDGVEVADEATLVGWAGHPVQVVPGAAENLRVSTVLDLAVAEALLARRRGGPGNPVGVPRARG